MNRKKKSSPNPGLTPSSLFDKIKSEASNEDMQHMSSKSTAKRRSVLLAAREGKTRKAGTAGIFSTAPLPNGGRTAGPEPEEVLDEPKRPVDLDVALSDMVRSVMLEEGPEGGISFMESMVRQVAIKAAKGDQSAIAWVGDRIEGKPGQAPKRSMSIEDTEQTIDQVEVAALNRLSESIEPQEGSDHE